MLTSPLDRAASWSTFSAEAGYTQYHCGIGLWKTADDLDRYRKAIEATRPEVLVETGTRWGGFAAWVADEFDAEVITVDAYRTKGRPARWPGVAFVSGDSTDTRIAAAVADLVGGRRCMVSLDSDHHAPHVEAEILAYGPLVTPGCYLVVEDGLADLVDADRSRRFGSQIPERGGPLYAIERTVAVDPAWRRDLDIEALTPVSHHPAGWWVRRG